MDQQTKITLETEKPPERKNVEEKIPEGAKPVESQRLPDVSRLLSIYASLSLSLSLRQLPQSSS